MPTIPRFVPPPATPIAIQELAVACDAIEYTRGFTVPTEALGAYVITMDARLSDLVIERISWTNGAPYPLVAILDNQFVVGWAPLAMLADAVEPFSPEAAALLREAPGSDVSLWTVVSVGINRITPMRVARDDLASVDTPDAELDLPPIDEGALDPGVLSDEGPLRFAAPTGACEWSKSGEHERGAPYVELDEDGEVLVEAVTCSKCWTNAVPREERGFVDARESE
jgi:hypothetical protein